MLACQPIILAFGDGMDGQQGNGSGDARCRPGAAAAARNRQTMSARGTVRDRAGGHAPLPARSRRPPPETTPPTRPRTGGVWRGTLPEQLTIGGCTGCDRQPDGQTGQNRPAQAVARGGLIGLRSGPRPPPVVQEVLYQSPSWIFENLRDHVGRTLISMGRREEILRRLMGSRSDNVRNMLAARRRMLDQKITPAGPQLVARTADRKLPRPVFPGLENSEAAYFGEGLVAATLAEGAAERLAKDRRLAGIFVPMDDSGPLGVVSYRPGMTGTRRHEVMHGYNHAAREGVPGMPLPSRLISKLPRSVAVPFDEMIATRAGGDRIIDVPWDYYAKGYREKGHLAAARIAEALHASQRAGRAVADNPMATGAGLVGGSALLYGLMSGEDGQ